MVSRSKMSLKKDGYDRFVLLFHVGGLKNLNPIFPPMEETKKRSVMMSILSSLSKRRIRYIPVGEYRLQIIKDYLYCEVEEDGSVSIQEYRTRRKSMKHVYRPNDWSYGVVHISLCV
jgi:hypothetical protein